MRSFWRREVGIGLIVGTSAGCGFLVLDWIAGVHVASAWHQWARFGYVALLGLVGAAAGCCYGRAYTQAITDPLTGLFNRRYYFLTSPHWFARAKRNGERISLLIMDIDNFKAINDRLGHHEGDRVLKTVAQAIRETCRGSDIPVRWGGEEFAVLLPETDASGAARAASRICKSVFERAGVSLSVGAATFPDVAEEALVTVADERMYEQKQCKAMGVHRPIHSSAAGESR